MCARLCADGTRIKILTNFAGFCFKYYRFNYKTDLLKNLTTGDAKVINVFNHTLMQGEKGVSAIVDLSPIDGVSGSAVLAKLLAKPTDTDCLSD